MKSYPVRRAERISRALQKANKALLARDKIERANEEKRVQEALERILAKAPRS